MIEVVEDQTVFPRMTRIDGSPTVRIASEESRLPGGVTSIGAHLDGMNPKQVLVADDEATIRDLLCYRLQRLGYTVREAGNGADALRALAEQAFDLVVIDVHMPDGGGLAVIREIRARGYGARVLAISGGGEQLLGGDSLNLALNMGANAMLAKPFMDAELSRAIDLAMRGVPDATPSENR